jgi:ATP-dependent DNA helicase RecQ
VLDQYVSINESLIATKLKSNVPDVKKALDILGKHEYLHYIAYSDSPKIIYIRPRVGTQHFSLDAKRMELRRKIKKKQLDAMLHYAEERSICRTVTLVEYFGEKLEKPCGICDVCLQRKKLGLEGADYDTLSAAIIQRLKEAPLSIQQLVKVLIPNDESKVLHTIEWLVECGEIGQNEQFKLEWKRK